MKRSFLFAVLTACVLVPGLLVGCGGSSGIPTVKIGIYEPASGDNGAGGKQETLGAIYANEVIPTVEIGGKEYKVELVRVDNESSNDKAVTAASELVSKGVSVVLGSYGSGVSIAASDTFAAADIPAIGITCTNPQVTLGNDHYFRICFLDPFQGTVLAKFAVDNFKAKKAYCLAKLGDDYSVGLCNYFIKAFEGLGGKVTFETFPEGTSDFAAYVANAKNTGADVFFSPVSTEAAALIIEQANTQGMGMPILAGDTWDSNVILGAVKGTNVDINVTTFFAEGSTDTRVAEFVEKFRSWIKADSARITDNGGNDIIAANPVMSYDAYNVALEALKLAGSTKGADIKAALPKVKYEGITGLIEFDQTGDAKRDVAYVKHANNQTGSWEFVAIQSVK
ncbi:MAG: ABC transporter substrate-binding protein [Treponema sp.]|nr:ABC transporter substrate-binding protein [Treponema sp.]